MKSVFLGILATAMLVGLLAWAFYVREQVTEAKDKPELVGLLTAQLIMFVFVVWAFHLPSYIADNYFGRAELNEDLTHVCAAVHNYTRLPLTVGLTQPCREALADVSVNAQRMATVPLCDRDEIIVGTGTYEDHLWTAYECAPAAEKPTTG